LQFIGWIDEFAGYAAFGSQKDRGINQQIKPAHQTRGKLAEIALYRAKIG
jgi:hypothetical protein